MVVIFFRRRAREDLETRTKKLSEVMANFGDVVPSKDYERLDAQFKVFLIHYLSHIQLFKLRLRIFRTEMSASKRIKL